MADNAEEATVNPDGSTTFESAGSGSEVPPEMGSAGGFEGAESSGFEGEVPPMDGEDMAKDVAGGIDPAFYLLFGFVIIAALYFYFFIRKKDDSDDDFFSNLEGDKFNLKLPAEVDEFYKIKAKCEAAGWEPGKGPPPGQQQQQGPHRVLAQALMKRAIADIPLVQFMQKESQGMGKLYAKSMCSVKQWRSYQAAEALVSSEVDEVRAEADEVEPGWSDVIWRQAMQYHTMLKKKHEMEAQQAQQKAKQLEKGKQAASAGPSVDDAKAREIAAQKAADELIREEEEREKQAKKAFAGGMKKGFLDGKNKKK